MLGGVYIVEKDACPCELLIRVGRIKECGKVDETLVSNFSPLPVSGRRGEGCPQEPNHISIQGWDIATKCHPRVPDVEHVP